MREKRIIKETTESGAIHYTVEERIKIFGHIVSDWSTAVDSVILRNGHESPPLEMVFDTLDEAKAYCEIDIDPVINREEIKCTR